MPRRKGHSAKGPLRFLLVVALVGSALSFAPPAASAALPFAEFDIPTANSGTTNVAVDTSGNLWFTEKLVNKVGFVTEAGDFTEYSADVPASPAHITAGPDGNMWFTSPNNISNITSGGAVSSFPVAGTPRGLTAGPDGNLWFTVGAANVGRMTTSGVVTVFPLATATLVAEAITVGPDNNLWFTARGSPPVIGKITTAGTPTEYEFPWPEIQFPTFYNQPRDIAAGPDGNLWFTTQPGYPYDYDSIVRVTTGGVFTEYPIGTQIDPAFIVAGPSYMWFSGEGSGRLHKIDMAGGVKSYLLPTGSAGEIVLDGDHLWFSAPGSNKLFLFDTSYLNPPARPPITINVPADQPTIQDGIDAAAVGDTVLVAPGTYDEELDYNGKEISVISSGGPEVTIINGNHSGSVVTFDTSEGPGAVLQGFTIQNGDGPYAGGGITISDASPTILENYIINNDSSFGSGGGIWVSGSPNIEGNLIGGNFAADSGGGIHMISGAARIFQNIIASNVACQGAGLWIKGSANVEANLIVDNFMDDCVTGTQYAGAGIYATSGSDMQIIGNQIEANEVCSVQCGHASGLKKGAGIAIDEGSTSDEYVINDNIIRGNFGAQTGGGIYTDADTTIVNNLIVENDASSIDGISVSGITSNPAVIVNNTITAGTGETGISVGSRGANTVQIYNNAIQGKLSCVPGQVVVSNNATLYVGNCADAFGNLGNITQPLNFSNPEIGDYTLRASSASINAGSNAAPLLPAEDITGRTRILEGTVDQGAFESYPRKELDPLVWESPEVPQKKDFPPDVFGFEVSSGSSSAFRPAATRATSEPVEAFILMGPAHVHERMLTMKRGRWRAHHDRGVARWQ